MNHTAKKWAPHGAEPWEYHARSMIWRMIGTTSATLAVMVGVMTRDAQSCMMAAAAGCFTSALVIGIPGHHRHYRPSLTKLLMAGMMMARREDDRRMQDRIGAIARDAAHQAAACGAAIALVGSFIGIFAAI